jgi:hypothetical protein
MPVPGLDPAKVRTHGLGHGEKRGEKSNVRALGAYLGRAMALTQPKSASQGSDIEKKRKFALFYIHKKIEYLHFFLHKKKKLNFFEWGVQSWSGLRPKTSLSQHPPLTR